MPIDNTIVIELIVMWTIGFAVIFRRTLKNLYTAIFYSKSYSVVHVRKSATRKPVVFFVVPDVVNNYLTRVGGKKIYELNPDNMAYKKKGRSHFIVNEEDTMPLKFREVELNDNNIIYKHGDHIYFKSDDKGTALKLDPRTDDDYIIGADRVDQGMYSKSLRILHGQENQLAFYIALGAALIALGVAIYAVYTIQGIKPLIEVIYSKVTPEQITIK